MADITALVIEDEEDIIALMEAILKREGVAVDSVYATSEGLDMLAKKPYDLVFTDLKQTPDGTVVYNEAVGRGMKAFIVTAGGPEELLTKARDIAGENLIMKPFSPSEIADKVSAYRNELKQKSP